MTTIPRRILLEWYIKEELNFMDREHLDNLIEALQYGLQPTKTLYMLDENNKKRIQITPNLK